MADLPPPAPASFTRAKAIEHGVLVPTNPKLSQFVNCSRCGRLITLVDSFRAGVTLHLCGRCGGEVGLIHGDDPDPGSYHDPNPNTHRLSPFFVSVFSSGRATQLGEVDAGGMKSLMMERTSFSIVDQSEWRIKDNFYFVCGCEFVRREAELIHTWERITLGNWSEIHADNIKHVFDCARVATQWMNLAKSN